MTWVPTPMQMLQWAAKEMCRQRMNLGLSASVKVSVSPDFFATAKMPEESRNPVVVQVSMDTVNRWCSTPFDALMRLWRWQFLKELDFEGMGLA